jgi:hypothetical protein
MVKNGLRSSFVYWRLIWACLTGNLDRVERWQIMGFQQILKESRVFPLPVEVASSPFEASRHATGLKTDAHIKTGPKPENKNQNHSRPNSGQGSALLRHM